MFAESGEIKIVEKQNTYRQIRPVSNRKNSKKKRYITPRATNKQKNTANHFVGITFYFAIRLPQREHWVKINMPGLSSIKDNIIVVSPFKKIFFYNFSK